MKLPDLRSADLAGKKVLLRLDLDVPFVRGVHDNPKFNVSILADPSRLEAALPTIKYLLDKKCKIVACGHLGRPRKQFSISPASPRLHGTSNFPRFAQASRDEPFPKENEEFSLQLIAKWFAYKLNSQEEETNIGEFMGWKIKEDFCLLENLRFHKGEEENSEEFAKKLAGLADVYVNDAFASSHRSHASIVGVCRLLPHLAGLHLQDEIKVLSEILSNPRRPMTVVIGGEKIETKLPLVEKMFGFADFLLVGGEIAGQKEALGLTGEKTELLVADLTQNGEDITDDSLNKFIEIINKSATVVWNGPLGVVRTGFSKTPTIKFARALSENPNVYSVVGGGDTVEVIVRFKLKDKFSFVSTGGGSMLEFLAGEKLPGLEALISR